MIRTFKTRVYPTAKQAEHLNQAFGIRRWAWNYGLSYLLDKVEKEEYPTAYDIQFYINNELVGTAEYEWLSDVCSMAYTEALKDLGQAARSWVSQVKRIRKKHNNSPTSEEVKLPEKGKPKFKKKGKCVESCRFFRKDKYTIQVVSNHHLTVPTSGRRPRLSLKTRETLEFLKSDGVSIKTCTISREAGKYYACLTYEKANQRPRPAGSGAVGIDLGIKHVAACWDGQNGKIVDVPSTLRDAEKHTELQSKKFSRTVPGSNRHERAKVRLQRAYAHEANIKKDAREKLTTFLVETYNVIKYDDFSFAGAMNLDRNRALYRVGVYAFKERLAAKAAERGVELTKVKAFTPTTKTCSNCGALKVDVKLSDRVYECPECGHKVDRDLNAAMNVYNLCS